MNLTRTAALAALVVLLTACGQQPSVELDVAPAGAPEETAVEDVPDEPEPATEEAVAGDAEDVPSDAEGAAEPATEAPAPTPDAGGTSAEPTPLPADPELVIGEDGCVTDVATGLVVTCHDPAAGPDE